MTRFDPRPDQPYARTADGDLIHSREEVRAYLQRTLEESTPDDHGHRRGKSVTILNPDRPDRIWAHVENVIDSALEDAMNELVEDVTDGDATEDEILNALRRVDVDLPQLFAEWMREQ